MRPAAGEINLALELLDSLDLRRLRCRETAGRHNIEATGNARTVVGRQQPATRGLVPCRGGDPGAKADVTAQIVAVGDEAEIAQDFRLGGVFLRPGPRRLELRIKRIAVVDGLDVAARAGIAIPVPGATDIAGLV